jgi:hypothetical protein
MIHRIPNHGLNGFPDHEIFLTIRVRKSAHRAVIRLDREKRFVLELQMGRLFFHNLKRHNALGTLIEQLYLLGNGRGRTGQLHTYSVIQERKLLGFIEAQNRLRRILNSKSF